MASSAITDKIAEPVPIRRTRTNEVPRKSRQANYKGFFAFRRNTCAAFAFDARGTA